MKILILAPRIAIVGVVLMWHAAWAQNGPVQSLVPPTPNVAALAKYGNVPMGLYTGQPVISFPLYEIKYPDFSFPISLSYSYSGCKVEDYPGWTGLGWTMSATGVITRQLRGGYDERADGYNGKNKRGETVVAFIKDGMPLNNADYQAFLEGVRNNRIDTEPDLFFISVPGLSGKFFFDDTQCSSAKKEGTLVIKEAVPIPHQNIKVYGYFDYDKPYSTIKGLIKKFEIVDQKGVKYTFDVLEKAADLILDSDNTQAQNDYGNAWYLSTITSPFGNKISFNYKFRTLDNPPTVFEQVMMPGEFRPVARYNETATTEAILTDIRFRNGVVTFTESTEPRLDWNPTAWTSPPADRTLPKSLASMNVFVEGNSIKKVDFTYGYFGFNARLRLDSFQERNGAQVLPPYKFEYEEGPVPRIGDKRALFSQDHWGYFTNTNYTTLLTPFFGYATTASGTIPFTKEGNLRAPTAASRTGLLRQITYPAGGTTTFTYEPNDFYASAPPAFMLPSRGFVNKASVSAKSACTNLNGEQQCHLGEKQQTTSFTVATSTIAKLSIGLDVANCGESGASVILQEKSTLRQIALYSLWQDAKGNKSTSSVGPPMGEEFAINPGEYELVAVASIESTCTSQRLSKPAVASVTYQEMVINTNGDTFSAGGYRVKSIEDCNRDETNACVTRTFDYTDVNDPTRSSGVLTSRPVYGHEITYLYGSGASVVETRGVVLTANSFIPVVGTHGAPVGYRYVTESRGANSGKTVHMYTSALEYPDEVGYYYPFPMRVDNDWQRGLEQESHVYNSQQQQFQRQASTLTQYTEFSAYSRTVALKLSPKLIVDPQLDYKMTNTDYHYQRYSLRAARMQPTTRKTMTVVNGIEHIVDEKMHYENPSHGLVTKTETSNSTGDVLLSTFSYTDDASTIAGLSEAEKAAIKSNPDKTALVEKIDYRNNIRLATQRNIYDGAKLIKAQRAIGTQPLEDDVQLGPYDGDGHPLYSMTKQGIGVSYQYGYNNQYLVAMATHAKPSEVFYTSFEDVGVLQLDTEQRPLAKTGDKVWRSSTFTFPASFTPSGTSLIMSYWYRTDNDGWQFKQEPFARTIKTTGTLLDEVRVMPSGATMVTYTYNPGLGITSVTDANNVVSYYEYDDLGRLIKIKDHDKNVVKSFAYGLKTSQ